MVLPTITLRTTRAPEPPSTATPVEARDTTHSTPNSSRHANAVFFLLVSSGPPFTGNAQLDILCGRGDNSELCTGDANRLESIQILLAQLVRSSRGGRSRCPSWFRIGHLMSCDGHWMCVGVQLVASIRWFECAGGGGRAVGRAAGTGRIHGPVFRPSCAEARLPPRARPRARPPRPGPCQRL